MDGTITAEPSSKKLVVTIVVAIIVVVLLGAAYWWFGLREVKTPEEKATESFEKSLQSAGAGTLPEINPLSNPLEEVPDINAVSKTNPFKDIKTNPFE